MKCSWLASHAFAVLLTAGACAPSRSVEQLDQADASVAPARWQRNVERSIAHGEQAISAEAAGYRAVNRANGLIASFDAAGTVRVSQRGGDAEISLRLA